MRPAVTEICFMGLDRLRGEFDMDVIAMYSGEFEALCRKHDVLGVKYQNLPLSDKWNAGIRHALTLKWDYLMTLGSDNLLANELLRLYEWQDEAFGITEIGGLDVRTGEKRIFRNGYVIGAGRCIRRDVVERFADMVTVKFKESGVGDDCWSAKHTRKVTRYYAKQLPCDIIEEHSEGSKLWADGINQGLDFSSEVMMVTNGIRQKKVLTKSVLAVDLKSETNIWPIESYEKGDFELPWISQDEHDAIRRLKTAS